jgi:hypothetical protein
VDWLTRIGNECPVTARNTKNFITACPPSCPPHSFSDGRTDKDFCRKEAQKAQNKQSKSGESYYALFASFGGNELFIRVYL